MIKERAKPRTPQIFNTTRIPFTDYSSLRYPPGSKLGRVAIWAWSQNEAVEEDSIG